jgi:formate dehydrogenase major subunit
MSASADTTAADHAAAMISFELDGQPASARPGETIWQVAHRMGQSLPHLCYRHEPGYRPDGNCRVCMVEVVGERVLAPSCKRVPTPGMKVITASDRAKKSRELVMELLVADQPPREVARDPKSSLWQWADQLGVSSSRFPASAHKPSLDRSHVAISVGLDACINCGLCERACREVQVNDVIGMAHRGHRARIVFDMQSPMGESTCVGCGECVQACPTGALLPASLVDSSGLKIIEPEDSVDSLCPYCGVGCQTTYHVHENKIVAVDGRNGPANHNRLCVKGRFGYDYISHPHRLTQPLIRRDDAPKSWDSQVDPANPWTHFRPATWAEALEHAAAGLRAIRDVYGPSSLAGFGSAKGSNEEAYLFQKLVRTGFGTNNVDHCTRLCHASSVAALMECIGSGAVTAPFSAAAEAEVIFIIGANPAVNHPVAATFIKNAVKQGARLYIADPRRQSLSRLATEHLQFRPGTDVALLSAMIHTIIEENLFDPSYVEHQTRGFAELKAEMADNSPEAMAPLCGIDAEVIRRFARDYATSRASIIFWGMGVSQHVHGTDNSRCLIALALLTGQVGRPGSGLHPLRGQNNVQGASDAGLIPMVFPDYKSVADPVARVFYEKLWGKSDLDAKPGLTVVEIMRAIHAGQVRGMYIMGENPAMSDPDLHHARQALSMLDHLVVQEIFLTETAWHADVVLPASAFPEKSGTFTNTDRRVQLARPAVMPPGDARQDLWIIEQLANRIGLDWHYDGPGDVFNEMRQGLKGFRGITWNRLERDGAVTYPCDAEDEAGHEIIFGDRFPTADGRGRLVPAKIVPPDEVPNDEYPMVLSTGRVLEHWHTGAMTRRAGVLDDIEPEPTVFVNPKELGRWGKRPGEFVTVETRRGEIRLKTRADRDVPPGMIFIPFCFAEAAANLLTNPALDPFGKIPEFKFCAARVVV